MFKMWGHRYLSTFLYIFPYTFILGYCFWFCHLLESLCQELPTYWQFLALFSDGWQILASFWSLAVSLHTSFGKLRQLPTRSWDFCLQLLNFSWFITIFQNKHEQHKDQRTLQTTAAWHWKLKLNQFGLLWIDYEQWKQF